MCEKRKKKGAETVLGYCLNCVTIQWENCIVTCFMGVQWAEKLCCNMGRAVVGGLGHDTMEIVS